MLTIFAGNLSPDTCEDNLRKRYAQHGTLHLLEGSPERSAARRHVGSSRR
jgi:hypothetical protein